MNLLASMGIAKRQYAVAILLSMALAGVAIFVYFNLNAVVHAAERTEKLRVPQLGAMASMELNITRVSLQLRHAMLARDPAEMNAALDEIAARRKALADTLQNYEASLFTDEGKRTFAPLPGLVARFWEVGEGNVALIKQGKNAEAFAYLVDHTIPARNAVLAAVKDGVSYQNKTLTHDIQHIESQVGNTLRALLAMVGVTMVSLMLSAWYIAGVLRRRVEASRAVAERVRDGDLSTVVHDTAGDEFTPLLKALGDMKTSLTRVVSGVRTGAEQVASASAQIAQGNVDLAGRTEEQASALQQTAASIDHLGSSARQNADNAAQANQLAVGASHVAQKGGEVVNQVVETMKAINQSSKRIVDIIGVIDGIAFQTNILALNAAVEAARAGEQGRGFAVVAGEVRNLAQRSADAAKEIKQLITASVERVGQGTVLVDQAGSTMQEVVTAIQRVADIMGEITSASVEQNAGVSLVGQAMSQMDSTTQQNSALVEQGSAAAQSLRSQAGQLVEAVAVFKLAHSAAMHTPSAAAPSLSMAPARRVAQAADTTSPGDWETL